MIRSVAGLAFALCCSLGFSACKSACPGLEVAGKTGSECENTCRDSACVKGQVCVDNACRPPCTTTADCGPKQTCTARVSDHGTKGSFCVGPSTASQGATTGTPCSASSDCDEKAGARCVDGTCTFTCEAHDDCVSCNSSGRCSSIGSCTGHATDAEGKAVRLCEKDSFPRGPGQFGSACSIDPCDEKNGFTCVGSQLPTNGTIPGDIDAYCTKDFCSGDSDCPSGFYCAQKTAPDPPCETTCGYTVDNTTPTSASCIALSDIGPGKRYTCRAEVSVILTNRCVHRTFCDACQDDTDCLGVRGQICAADESGEKICTVLCDDNINSCPWGSASFCRTTDTALGAPTCSHRFGSCHASGKSCEPCRDHSDCPTGVCNVEHFTNEHYCVDFTASCSCPAGTNATCSGGGCPTSPPPASLTLACYGGDAVKGSVFEGRCVGSASGTGCWPSL